MMHPLVMLLAAIFSAWLLGTLLVAACRTAERSFADEAGLLLPLGLLLGLAATSVTFFSASLWSKQPALTAGIFDLVGGLILAGWIWRRKARHGRLSFGPFSWATWLLISVFVQVAVTAFVLAWRAYAAEPYGGWDAWAIWNLNARFMFRAGTAWPEFLSAPQLGWTHPDYPRLVSASVARVWSWVGAEDSRASALVSVLFAGATAWFLVALVSRVRGRVPALLAGLLLVSTPFFVTFAPNQHADIPLGAFMLAAVGLALLGKQWALAGLCAACAAWTKNEGLLFALVFTAACGVRTWRRGDRANAMALLRGLAVGLIPVLFFKLFLAPANDLISAPLGPRLAQLFDFGRHRLIFSSLVRDLGLFGEWRWMPYLAMALPFAAWRRRRRLNGDEILLPILLGLMLGGFYVVYVFTPQDLAWHLDTSLVRLLLQLWPISLLTWSLALPPFEIEVSILRRSRVIAALFLAANLLVAKIALTRLSHQLAADELAIRDRKGATITAAVGEGWYGVERDAGEQWSWSSGRGILRLRTSDFAPDLRVTLRLDLRSLSSRTVVIREGTQLLWQGSLSDEFRRVEIKDFPLTRETTRLEFTTDAPGVPEAATAGARALAFAVYHVQLR